jgi:hypothetical protein
MIDAARDAPVDDVVLVGSRTHPIRMGVSAAPPPVAAEASIGVLLSAAIVSSRYSGVWTRIWQGIPLCGSVAIGQRRPPSSPYRQNKGTYTYISILLHSLSYCVTRHTG